MKMRRSKARRKASKRTHTTHTNSKKICNRIHRLVANLFLGARHTHTTHTHADWVQAPELAPVLVPTPAPANTKKRLTSKHICGGSCKRNARAWSANKQASTHTHTHAHTQKANNHSYTRQRILQSPRQTCYKNFPARASTLSGFPGPLPKTQRTSCLSTSAGVAAKNVLPRRKNNQENPTHMQKAKKHTQGKGFCSHSDRCAAKLLCVGRPHTHTQRRTQAIRASANQKTLLV